MVRFALRHITSIIILVALAWWAIFYLPNTPTFAVLRLKQAVDARDGDAAVQYVDFDSVVKYAGQEMVNEKAHDPLSALIGQAAVAIFSKPMAALLESTVKQKVERGDPDIQMPPASVLGALALLHRDDDTAWTDFKDPHGQRWKIHLARENGRWELTQIENVSQLLQKLQEHEEKNFSASPANPAPEPSP